MIVIGIFVALSAWATSSPAGSSPDDDFHLTSIWCSQISSTTLCETTSDTSIRNVNESLVKVSCFASDANVSGGCQKDLGLFDSSKTVETDRGSFTGNYPPLFYGTMNLFAGEDIPSSALLMRILNVALFASLLAVILFALPLSLSRTVVVMWLITLVPLGLFLVASNNPSSWALTGLGMGWVSLYGFLTIENSRRWILLTTYVISGFMAAGSRGDAALYFVLVSVVVTFLCFVQRKDFYFRLIFPLAMSLVALIFFFSSQQSGVATTGLPFSDLNDPTKDRTALGVLFYNIVQLPFLFTGIFGTWNLGWLDTVMPGVVWALSLAVFISVMFTSLSQMSKRIIASLIFLFLVIVSLPLYVLQAALAHVGEQVQPRYVFPLVIVFAGISLLTIGKETFRFSPLQSVVIFIFLAVSQSVALYVNTRRYVWGLDSSSGWNLDVNTEWWWNFGPSPMFNWVLGSLGFAVFVLGAGAFFKASQAQIHQGKLLSK